MVVTRPHTLGGEGGARLTERVFQRVDDERRGNRFGHRALRVEVADSTAKPAPSRRYGVLGTTTMLGVAENTPGTLARPAASLLSILGASV